MEQRKIKWRALQRITMLLIPFFAFGCVSSRGSERESSQRTSGSEKSETRRIDNFTAIELNSMANIRFTQDKNVSLRITGPEADLARIKTETKNGELRIYVGESYSQPKNGRVEIELTAPDLKKVSVTGMGDVTINQPLAVGNLELRLTGMGGINIEKLKCNRLDAYLSGMGEISLAGQCVDADLRMSGVGSIDALGLSGRVSARCSGVGKIKYGGADGSADERTTNKKGDLVI